MITLSRGNSIVNAPLASSNRRNLLLLVAAVPLLGACGGSSPLHQADIRPVSPEGLPGELPAPALQVGTEWRYVMRSVLTGLTTDRVQLRVSAVEADGYVVAGQSEAGAFEARLDRDLNPIRNRNVAFAPPYPRYAFPLTIGKAWRTEVRTTVVGQPDQGTLLQNVSASVRGWERVTVPAGIFTTLRIDLAIEWQNTRDATERGNSTETFWYSAQVQNAVLHHRTDYASGRVVTNDSVTSLESLSAGA
jgi:hypothetical protein